VYNPAARPLGFEQLLAVHSYAEHLDGWISGTQRPPGNRYAGNGMCSGGRIANYLKAMPGDRGTTYRSVLSGGRHAWSGCTIFLSQKGGCVDFDGERLAIRAGVTTIGGYSAHADQDGLVKFVTNMRRRPSHIRIVHGESKAKQALAARLAAIYQDKQQPLLLEIPP